MTETYTIDIRCRNCKAWNWLKINRGRLVEEFLEEDNIRCRVCNCLMAKQKKNKDDSPIETKKVEKEIINNEKRESK